VFNTPLRRRSHRSVSCWARLWHFMKTFADYMVGGIAELDAAIAAAKGALEPMTGVYVYDDTGRLKFNHFEPSEVLPRHRIPEFPNVQATTCCWRN